MTLIKTLIFSFMFLALSTAFQHSASDPPGIYLHSISENGTEIKEYVGEAPDYQPHNARSLLSMVSAKFRPRDTAPGYTVCQEQIVSDVDYTNTVNQLANWCGSGQSFTHSVSFKSKGATAESGAVAYACAYQGLHKGSKTCEYTSVQIYEGVVNGACGASRAGYYMIEVRQLRRFCS